MQFTWIRLNSQPGEEFDVSKLKITDQSRIIYMYNPKTSRFKSERRRTSLTIIRITEIMSPVEIPFLLSFNRISTLRPLFRGHYQEFVQVSLEGFKQLWSNEPRN